MSVLIAIETVTSVWNTARGQELSKVNEASGWGLIRKWLAWNWLGNGFGMKIMMTSGNCFYFAIQGAERAGMGWTNVCYGRVTGSGE